MAMDLLVAFAGNDLSSVGKGDDWYSRLRGWRACDLGRQT